jgi:tRNA A37 threonylcarbamoyladenosine modification protein TsaB
VNYLAIDTANEYLAVVARVGGKTVSRYLPDCAMKHSTALMVEVDGLLQENGFSLSQIDVFAAVAVSAVCYAVQYWIFPKYMTAPKAVE